VADGYQRLPSQADGGRGWSGCSSDQRLVGAALALASLVSAGAVTEAVSRRHGGWP